MSTEANDPVPEQHRTILIVGASRGIGHAMATEFLQRGWSVVATVRDIASPALNELVDKHGGWLRVETLDINSPAGIMAIRERLSGLRVDILFVNAGTTTLDEHAPIGEVSTEEFTRVMMTNALGPMRVVEALHALVPAGGVIGAMTSGQASITNNETGGREVYRASKAALNMLMRSFANRITEPERAVILLAPGWIRTALGGPDAMFSLEETIPDIVDTLVANLGRVGVRYIDRFGEAIPY